GAGAAIGGGRFHRHVALRSPRAEVRPVARARAGDLRRRAAGPRRRQTTEGRTRFARAVGGARLLSEFGPTARSDLFDHARRPLSDRARSDQASAQEVVSNFKKLFT